jgi:hypothetical protein
MMCPDHRAVDHVGSAIAACHFRQGFEHRVEHPGLHPSAVAPEHAVPLAIFIGKVTPLRACPGHPHHAFKIQPVVLRGATTSAPLRWQERANQCPFLVRHTNPLAQRRLPKDSLESTSESPVKLCPRNLEHICNYNSIAVVDDKFDSILWVANAARASISPVSP